MHAEYPFGVDDAKLTAFEGDDLGTVKVDVLGVRAISVQLESETVEHRGDQMTVRTRRSGKKVTGSVEMAAHHQATMAVAGDGEVTTTGTTPAIVSVYTEPDVSVGKEYQIEAQASDGLEAARITVMRATTSTGPSLSWTIDQFSSPTFDYEGKGFGGALYKLEQFETAVDIV